MRLELTIRKQKTIFERAVAGFENGQVKDMVYDAKAVEDRPPLQGSEAERNLIALYTALIRGLKPETALPFADADAFLASKVEWALSAQNAFQQRSALDLISAFVNKHAAQLSSLPALLEGIWTTVTDASQPASKRQVALQVYFHVRWPFLLKLTSDREGARPLAERAGIHGFRARALPPRDRRCALPRDGECVRSVGRVAGEEAPLPPDCEGELTREQS